jgi:hypothetical protein
MGEDLTPFIHTSAVTFTIIRDWIHSIRHDHDAPLLPRWFYPMLLVLDDFYRQHYHGRWLMPSLMAINVSALRLGSICHKAPHDEFMFNTAHGPTPTRPIQHLITAIRCLVACLPGETRHLLTYLVRFFRSLHDQRSPMLSIEYLHTVSSALAEWFVDETTLAVYLCDYYMHRITTGAMTPDGIHDYWKGCSQRLFLLILVYHQYIFQTRKVT